MTRQTHVLEVKNFDHADETRPFEAHRNVRLVRVNGREVGLGTFEPGWSWRADVKPIMQTTSCEFPHFLYVLAGRMRVTMSDGREIELQPGDVASIPPGHDAETVGDEPCLTIDLAEDDVDYAKRG